MLLFNIILTRNLLLRIKIALPLHPVISFSVINYVVSMRHPRESDEVSFSFIYPQSRLMLSILRCSVPEGTWASAISPTFFPINAAPIGDFSEIIPASRFIS